MDLTRRHLGFVFAGLYVIGGLLLLVDYWHTPADAGAHLPLAWHVFPVSFVATLIAMAMDRSAPLDPVWHVSQEAVVVAFAVSGALCAAAVMRILSGRAAASGANCSDEDGPPEN